MPKKLTTQEFIQKAGMVNGQFYDYSKVDYVNNCTKIEIICPIHGNFWQIPNNHLLGYQCIECGNIKVKLARKKTTSTTESFKQKANTVHHSRYDYSKATYINSKTKLEIICKKHGSFWQKPNDHLYGKGCIACAGNIKLTTTDFIEKARKIHGFKYDYTGVTYITTMKQVKITCLTHGSFWQRPNNHLNGQGCQKCHFSNLSSIQRTTTEEFIDKATKVHSNLYCYSNVNYINGFTKVEIICDKHRSFWQIPNNHLCNHGCPKCSHIISKPETKWLDEKNVSKEYRQYKIRIGKRQFRVDGFDPTTNTIYEFLGDYYHGNPEVYDKNKLNQRVKKTFGVLYQNTIGRIKLFEKHGFNVKYIWEKDYDKKNN